MQQQGQRSQSQQPDQLAPLIFGSFRLDPKAKRLWRGEKSIELEPRPFAVLLYLAQQPDQLVPQIELLQQLWPDTYVTKTALRVCVRAIRKALGDSASHPRYIETVPRQGYRFIGELQRPQRTTLPLPDSGSLLVGREAELLCLQRLLGKALDNTRQVVFVTGEAGIGKTALVDTFLERVQARDVLSIGRGQCLEQYGEGEAYLPILEALSKLCRLPGGGNTYEILLRYAPTWLLQMPGLVPEAEIPNLYQQVAGATRGRMLREIVDAIEALAASRPLILVLEDLHWSDRSTLELCAYLARREGPARLFILATARPTDTNGHASPITSIKHELHVHHQCEEILLGLLRQDDVERYIMRRFSVAPGHPFQQFAQLVYQRTEGSPLFMVNLVTDAVRQAFIVQQESGHWRLQGNVSHLPNVPDTLQQMIEKQIEALQVEERQLLEVASVAGREFAVTSVAAGGNQAPATLEALCEKLAQQGRFLTPAGLAEWPDGTLCGRYRFQHTLYQQVLYARLSQARRIRLHRLIGEYEETGYGERANTIAPELAVHFEHARDYPRAIAYRYQAGQNALRRHAYQEAVQHLTTGLAQLDLHADQFRAPQHTLQALQMQMALGTSLVITQGYASPGVRAIYTQALGLCQQLGDQTQLFPILFGLWMFYATRAEYHQAQTLAQQLLSIAHRENASSLSAPAYHARGIPLVFTGELTRAHHDLVQGLQRYDMDQQRPFTLQSGLDAKVGCLAYDAMTLWLLGYPQRSLQLVLQLLDHANALDHPFSLARSLCMAGIVYQFRQDPQQVIAYTQSALSLSSQQEFPLWSALSSIGHGWALVRQGQAEQGLSQLQQGVAAFRTIGMEQGHSYNLAVLAEAYISLGQPEKAHAVLAQAFQMVEVSAERVYEAELCRLRGESLLLSDEHGTQNEERQKKATATPSIHHSSFITLRSVEAEECFQQALELARKRNEKSLELRAAMSLARVWQQQGKKSQAYHLLYQVYSWFTEGFDTVDLQHAKVLLRTLS